MDYVIDLVKYLTKKSLLIYNEYIKKIMNETRI